MSALPREYVYYIDVGVSKVEIGRCSGPIMEIPIFESSASIPENLRKRNEQGLEC